MSAELRTVAVVTTARADYSYYRPLLSRIVASGDLRLHLIVTGSHLSPWFGATASAIEADGFEIGDRVEMLISGDTPAAITTSMGVAIIAMAQVFSRTRPDILLLLGDRFEMLACAVAALPFAIPTAHIAGGEATEGAIDDAARHAITKMSHLHFVQAETYRNRVIQMGEEPWRVVLVGAASIDNLRDLKRLSREDIERRFGVRLDPAPLIVTFHPVTLEAEQIPLQIRELLAALEIVGLPVIFTGTNADANNSEIAAGIARYLATHQDARAVINFGPDAYFSVLPYAAALAGNSSSGIVEAASFQLPVVNIGNRQAGRIHERNVIDVPCTREAIATAIRRATSAEFRQSLEGLRNPYENGGATDAILQTLRTTPLGPKLLVKPFHQLPRE